MSWLCNGCPHKQNQSFRELVWLSGWDSQPPSGLRQGQRFRAPEARLQAFPHESSVKTRVKSALYSTVEPHGIVRGSHPSTVFRGNNREPATDWL